jgi:hypothetical protein
MVQHVIPHGGLGLKFTAITDQDCPNLVALINRVCAPQEHALRVTSAITSLGM